MPLTDRDPNASGRTSRASNMSAGSRGLQQKGHGPASRADLLSSAGVMSMLRTSTEVGDIGGLMYDPSSNMPRGPPRRGGASSRMSTCSSQSNTSRRASSGHQVWPSGSSTRPRSMTRDNNVPQYVPDTLSPTIMNLPGSSPLFPRTRNSRDGHRSLSMTNTSQPTFRLSSNRSFASLRVHENVQRPRSPYHYPTRLRRPGYRPASPALSDTTGTQVRRPHGYPGYPAHPGQLGHPRLRHPSDLSVYRDDRGYMMSGYTGRSRSPTFLGRPHPDIPPLPLNHHLVVEQTRMLHRPAKGSISSGSTNRRTDSDAPSSDAPSPPTPREGRSMETLIMPLGTQMLADSVAGAMKQEVSTSPLYYDYSEQFEREEFIEPEADPVPTSLVHHNGPVLGGRVEPTPIKVDVTVRDVAELPGSDAIDIAELAASPVVRRITRDMILAALEPVSTTGEMGSSRLSTEESGQGQQEEQGRNELGSTSLLPEESMDRRHSIVTSTGSSIVDSCTLDFTVRYSVPLVTGTGTEAPTRSESLTEDGMSDLLDGYRHTETNQEKEMVVARWESTVDEPAGTKSNHTPKSSDAQSFKSCTNLREQSDQKSDTKSIKTVKDSDVKSFQACKDLPEQPFKDSDARSFKTCKDLITPSRAVSMPPLRLSSSNLACMEPKGKRPISEVPLHSPLTANRDQPCISPRESSFSKVNAGLMANSKLSSKHGASTVTSISSSINTLAQLPPVVPPRESSSSKEAQRTQAVADFLVRLSRPRRFSRVHSSFGKKQAKDGKAHDDDSMRKTDLSQEHEDVVGRRKFSSQSPEVVKTPEKVLGKENIVPEKYIPAGEPSKECVSTKDGIPAPKSKVLVVHQYSVSTPPPAIAEPSSIYSPNDISSSSSRARVQSSPMAFVKSPEHGRRDSQTTTHLTWNDRKTLSLHSGNFSESRANQVNGHDETTTNLRLSAYRYPLHYLPDLKEESHEDSSLNTSASNLKNSNFRFPFGGQPGASMSGDDDVLCGRNPSTNSCQQSLAHTRGLPSMNFSRMNLIEKLNEALDIRCSRSLDGAADYAYKLAQSNAVRPSSAGEIREKYRSFFASLDELEKIGDDTQPSAVKELMPIKQIYSPVHLMAEIDELTIPSVGGLTQRLSEFLPSLKEYYRLGEVGEFTAEEVIMEHALEKIHEVGGPAPKRSSARLRPMPGSPTMVVIDDALYDELTGREIEHGGPVSSSGGENESLEKDVGGKGEGKGIVNAPARDPTPLAELEAPSPAILRTRSLSLGHQDLRPSLESWLSSRRSLRSLATSTPTATTTDTRPWNSDKNYPWATTVPAIDISLPSPTFTRTSPRPGPSRLREHLSGSSHTSASSPRNNNTLAFSLTTMSMDATNVSHGHGPLPDGKPPNKPQSEGFDASGYATRPLRLCEGDQSHDAGERYPFSALTPPTNLHLPGTPESFFSADSTSSQGRPTTTKKSRFNIKSRFKSSGRGAEAAQPAFTHHGNHSSTSIVDSMQDGAGEARDFTSHRQTFSGAEGMSTSTYRRHRIQGFFKKLWHKGGELIRNLSKRNGAPRGQSSGQFSDQSPFPNNVEDMAVYDADGRRRVPLSGSRGVPLWTGV